MPEFDREIQVAEALAREAGALILSFVGSGISVEYKGEDGPVTRADREANALIVSGLERSFADDGILSEEIPDTGAWHGRERVWMVDPLDGTKDFIRGRAGYAVMIGLCIAGRPALGVVFQPSTGVLYRAVRGQGGQRVSQDGSATPLVVSSVTPVESARLVASASHRTEMIDRVREVLGVEDELNVGSVGLKLGLIAAGERDLYVNPASRSSLWDSCAPEAILVEAGGRVTNLAGQPLDYAGPELKNSHGLVASNGLIHDEVIARIAKLFPNGKPEY